MYLRKGNDFFFFFFFVQLEKRFSYLRKKSSTITYTINETKIEKNIDCGFQ